VGTEGWSKGGRSETAGIRMHGMNGGAMDSDRGILHEERESDVTATHAV
jgi:hypothetical protein